MNLKDLLDTARQQAKRPGITPAQGWMNYEGQRCLLGLAMQGKGVFECVAEKFQISLEAVYGLADGWEGWTTYRYKDDHDYQQGKSIGQAMWQELKPREEI